MEYWWQWVLVKAFCKEVSEQRYEVCNGVGNEGKGKCSVS